MSDGAEVLALAPVSDQAFADAHGVSTEAVALLRASTYIDLHIDTFIPPRLVGYDLFKRHRRGFFLARFGHLDFPRICESSLDAAMWSITTNPFRTAKSRWRVFLKNLERLQSLIARTEGRFRVARNHRELTSAVKAGAHAALISIQGGNALAAAPEGPASIPGDLVTRVTLVHLTNSVYGVTSSPLKAWKGRRGLSAQGVAFIEGLNARRIFVDLAHINRPGFWHAVEVHDADQPLIATHTGVCGVKPHWRNLDDAQIRAIADTGGVVGVIFARGFLKRRGGPNDCRMIVEHLAHAIDVGGEDVAAIGSDYDGAILPPKGLRSGEQVVRLVQAMLDRGWSHERIAKILGLNFMRAFEALRPGPVPETPAEPTGDAPSDG